MSESWLRLLLKGSSLCITLLRKLARLKSVFRKAIEAIAPAAVLLTHSGPRDPPLNSPPPKANNEGGDTLT